MDDIDDSRLFLSPIKTLEASLDEADSYLSLPDIADAYELLHTRLRGALEVFGTRMESRSTNSRDFGMLSCAEGIVRNRETLARAVVRDVRRAILDPFEYTNLHPGEDHSLDLDNTYLSSSQSEEYQDYLHAVADEISEASLAALKVAGLILTIDYICQLFTDTQMGSMLDAVLALFQSSAFSIPQQLKIQVLAMWILSRQILTPEVFTRSSGQVMAALAAACGPLRKHVKLLRDAFSTAVSLLDIYPTIFILPMASEILPLVLCQLVSKDSEVQTQAFGTLRAFCRAIVKVSSNNILLENVCRLSAEHIDKFVASHATAHKDGETAAFPFKDYIIQEIKSSEKRRPASALMLLACLVIPMGRQLFSYLSVQKLLLELLEAATTHQRSTIRVMTSWVWRCLVWCFQQFRGESREVYADALNTVLQRCLGGAGIATMAVTSGPHRGREGQLRQIVNAIRRILTHRTEGSRKDGVGLLFRLTAFSVDQGGPASRREWVIERLVNPLLFGNEIIEATDAQVGQLVKDGQGDLAAIDDVTPLDSSAIISEWPAFIRLCKMSVAVACMHPLSEPSVNEAHGIWNNLLHHWTLANDSSKAPNASSLRLDLRSLNREVFKELGPIVKGSKRPSTRLSNLHTRFYLARCMLSHTMRYFSGSWLQEIHRLLYSITAYSYRPGSYKERKEWTLLLAELFLGRLRSSRIAVSPLDNSESRARELTRSPEIEDLSDAGRSSGDRDSGPGSLQAKLLDVMDGTITAHTWKTFLRASLLYISGDLTLAGRIYESVFECTQSPTFQETESYFQVVLDCQNLALEFRCYVPCHEMLEMLATAMSAAYFSLICSDVTRLELPHLASEVLTHLEDNYQLEGLYILQEVAALYLEDEHCLFSDSEYDEELLSLYQLSLSLLGRLPVTVENLNEFEILIMSPFDREPPRPLVPIVFLQFWQNHCSHLYDTSAEKLKMSIQTVLHMLRQEYDLEIPSGWLAFEMDSEDFDVNTVPETYSDDAYSYNE